MDGATIFVTADDGTLSLRPGETAAQVLAQRRDLELHSYYHEIQAHTFRSKFIPEDVDTARAWRLDNRGAELSTEDVARMSALRTAVSTEIQHILGSERHDHAGEQVQLQAQGQQQQAATAPRREQQPF